MKRLLQRYRYSVILLRELVRTDFKLRYQGSVLGYLWSLLRPLFLFIILYIVFTKFLKVGTAVPHYPVYLLLGIVLWNFFVEVTAGSVGAIVGRGDLLRKINFPRYIIVLSISLGALINLGLNLIVIAVFMTISRTEISKYAIWAPFLMAELYCLALGVAFFLSALYVKFRDVNYIWEVILQGAFYATPIFYSLATVPTSIAKLLILSPMAQIIQDLRYGLVTQQTLTISGLYHSRWMQFAPLGITVIVVVAAAYYFRKQSRYFAEDV